MFFPVFEQKNDSCLLAKRIDWLRVWLRGVISKTSWALRRGGILAEAQLGEAVATVATLLRRDL